MLRQASRRSWRIGQRQPVEVTHLVYDGTLQAEALALAAAKLRSSLMVEGELPEDGLAALGGDGQDVLLALARRLVEVESGTGASVEAAFAQAQAVATQANDWLAEGDWLPLAEPSPMIAAGPGLAPGAMSDGVGTGIHQSRGLAAADSVSASDRSSDKASPQQRMIQFEDMAQLVRRPKTRRKPVLEGQLRLFNS